MELITTKVRKVIETRKAKYGVMIKVELPEGIYTGFVKDEDEIREGEELKLYLFEKNGYKNFRLPSKSDLLKIELDELRGEIDQLKSILKNIIKLNNLNWKQ